MRRVDGEEFIFVDRAREVKIGFSEEGEKVGRVSESERRKHEQRFCGEGSLSA